MRTPSVSQKIQDSVVITATMTGNHNAVIASNE